MKNTDAKLKKLAQKCTVMIAKSGVSREDGLLIVLNMLRYHSSLCMSKAEHDAFVNGIKALLQQIVSGTCLDMGNGHGERKGLDAQLPQEEDDYG